MNNANHMLDSATVKVTRNRPSNDPSTFCGGYWDRGGRYIGRESRRPANSIQEIKKHDMPHFKIGLRLKEGEIEKLIEEFLNEMT